MNLTCLRAGSVALALLLPSLVYAQGAPTYQSGLISPGNAVKAGGAGIVQDGGGLLGDVNGKGLNPFSVTDGLGLGVCSNTSATGNAYNALCFGHDANGNGLITLDSYGGYATKSLGVRINGATYPITSGATLVVDAVRDAGFVANGVIDNSAGMASIFARTDGPTVYFGPGTYMIGCPTGYTAASAISLRGAGKSVTTLKIPAGCVLPANAFIWQNRSGPVVEDLTVDLNGATYPGPAPANVFNFTGDNDGAFTRNAVINAGSGYINEVTRVAGASNSVRFAITENYLHFTAPSGNQNQCVTVSTAGGTITDGDVSRNVCVNSAMDLAGTEYNVVGNDISGWGYGAGIVCEANTATNKLALQYNHIHDAAANSSGAPNGIECWAANSNIANNIVHGAGNDGIDVGGQNTIVANNLSYANCKSSNVAANCTGFASRFLITGGHTYAADGSIYVGNVAYDNGSTLQKYGYVDQSGVGETIAPLVYNNDFTGNATGRVSLNGSKADQLSQYGNFSAQTISWTAPSIAQNTTNYTDVAQNYGGNTQSMISTIAGTFRNLYFAAANTPASGQTFTATLYTGTVKNSLSATAVTCVVTSASGSNQCSDLTHSAAITAGAYWSIQIVTSATSGATGNFMVATELDTP